MKIKKYFIHSLVLIMIVFGLIGPLSQVKASVVNPNEACNGGSQAESTNQPCIPSGCNFGEGSKLGDLFNYATCIINTSVIPLIFTLALAMFVWGVVQFVINGDDEVKKTKGKQFMIWGIIGLTVMVGVWGLVGILGNTFGLGSAIPQVRP